MSIPQCISLEFPHTLSQWQHIRFWLSDSGISSKKLHYGKVDDMLYCKSYSIGILFSLLHQGKQEMLASTHIMTIRFVYLYAEIRFLNIGCRFAIFLWLSFKGSINTTDQAIRWLKSFLIVDIEKITLKGVASFIRRGRQIPNNSIKNILLSQNLSFLIALLDVTTLWRYSYWPYRESAYHDLVGSFYLYPYPIVYSII